MNPWRSLAAYAACTLLFAGGCAIDDVKTQNSTGGAGGAGATTAGATTGGTTAGTATATGGSVSTGGTQSAGASSGGTLPTTGGTTGTGGTAGGAGPTGGTAGSDSGAGGSTSTGGTPPTGGMGGTGGTGGSQAGGGGAGGMSEDLSPNAIIPMLDGFLWVGTCASATTTLDCAINDDNNACPNTGSGVAYAMRGAFRRKQFPVLGTMGRNYRVNFEVRGVTGGKNYTGGTRGPNATAFNEAAGQINDGWYIGGTPTDSLWNTYEVRVTGPTPFQAINYYTNGFPTGTGDGWHGTVIMKIVTSFVVAGRGNIELVIHDSNCQGQQNCGPTGDTKTNCTAAPGPRTVDLNGMDPMPTNFSQPYAQPNNMLHPQWLLWDVKSITVE